MFITYTPEGEAEQKWDFDPGRVRATEAELIEKRFGGRWEAFLGDVQAGSIRARRVLLWHLLRKTHHTLRYEDTPDFTLGELKVEHSYSELVTLRDRVLKANLPDEEREQVLTALDLEITEAMTSQDAEAEGKATSNSAA